MFPILLALVAYTYTCTLYMYLGIYMYMYTYTTIHVHAILYTKCSFFSAHTCTTMWIGSYMYSTCTCRIQWLHSMPARVLYSSTEKAFFFILHIYTTTRTCTCGSYQTSIIHVSWWFNIIIIQVWIRIWWHL